MWRCLEKVASAHLQRMSSVMFCAASRNTRGYITTQCSTARRCNRDVIEVSSVYTIYSRETCISEKWVQLWAKLSYRKTVTVRALPRTTVEYAILPTPNVPKSCKGPFNWLKIPPLQKLTTHRNSTMTRIVPSPSLCQSNNSSDMRKATSAFALSNDVSGFSWWCKSDRVVRFHQGDVSRNAART